MQPMDILVLFGGCSTEYGVSLESAYAVLTHMDPNRYRPVPVGISQGGAWFWYPGPLEVIPQDRWLEQPQCVPCTLRLDRGSSSLLLLDGSGQEIPFSAVFPVLHGKNGEDGTVQGIFDLAGVPIIGCGTLSSALCMDKVRSHQLASFAGVAVPKGKVLNQPYDPSEWSEAAQSIGYPLFVKPVRAGSSFGITRLDGPEGLISAVEEAFLHDREILLEEAVPGFEVGCAVLGNQELTVGLVDEIELSGEFFNFEEKYTLKTSTIHCPARISPEKADEIRETAKHIYRALDCRVFARVDLFLTPEGRILLNEVNTIPGFTSHSRYPTMMKGIGLDLPALLNRIIELGVEP